MPGRSGPSRFATTAATGAILVAGWGGSTLATEVVQTIVLSGAAAPVNPAGAKFSQFGQPSINEHSQVTFRAEFTGTGVGGPNNSGVFFANSPGSVSRLLQEGVAAPGLPGGYTVSGFTLQNTSANGLLQQQALDSGIAALVVPVTVSGSNQTVAYLGPAGGTLSPVAIPGQTTPSGKGTWGTSFSLTMNSAGMMGLADNTQSTLWQGSSAASLKALSDVTNISRLAPGDMRMTGDGKLLVDMLSRDPFTQGPPGVFDYSSGSALTKILANGDAAPGMPGKTIYYAYMPSANPSGNLAVSAMLKSGTTSSNVVWTGSFSSTNLTPYIASGASAPGLAGVTIKTMGGPKLTPAGQVFIGATISGAGVTTANDGVVMVGSASSSASLKIIAREGDLVPGGGGLRFAEGDDWSVNAAGQMVVSSSTLLIGYDSSLGLVSLAKAGDSIQVSPGVTKTILSFVLSGDDYSSLPGGYNDGNPRALNDLGEVAFRAIFTDSSQGVFTARIPVAGDTNDDGIVDGADLKTLLTNFNHAGTRADGDFNLDGRVDFRDFQMLELNYGRTPPGMAAAEVDAADLVGAEGSVPEPGSVAFLFAGLLFMRRRRTDRGQTFNSTV